LFSVNELIKPDPIGKSLGFVEVNVLEPVDHPGLLPGSLLVKLDII
jgi:hypothetical protein